MSSTRLRKVIVTLVLSVAPVSELSPLFVSVTAAQSITASIFGTIYDEQRGVLLGAAVTMKDLDTGQIRSTTSSETGTFRIVGLSPGRHELTVELAAFAKTVTHIELNVGEELETNPLSAMFTSAPTPEVRTTKDGFIPKSARFPASAIQGNPVTMYFGLEPTTAPAMIAGVYTMTVTASSTCTDLPADVRTRTNTATIRQDFSDPSSVDIIPSGDSPGDFYGGVLDNSVGLLTDPDSQFPYPSEVVLAPLDSGRFLVANGTLTGRITGSTIDTILDGDLGVAERPFLTALATCRAADHRLTFVRQSNGEMRAVQTRGKK